MVKKAKNCKWKKTDNPLIFHSEDKAFLKILTTTVMNGDPRVFEVTANQQIQLGDNIESISELRQEMEKCFT
jgi:hypothetical protein